MQFETMDQRGIAMSSQYFEDICLQSERQIGFWKHKAMPDHHDEMVQLPGKLIASSPLERVLPNELQSADCLPEFYVASDPKRKLHIGGEEGINNLPTNARKFTNHHPTMGSNLYVRPASYGMEGSRVDINGTQYESSLFSSSFSEIFSKKLRLPVNDILFHESSNTVAFHNGSEEPFSNKEIEVQNIGNLLPDEDDLFSGMIDELGFTTHANSGDDIEDFDLFSSGGGMELEGDESSRTGKGFYDFVGEISNGQMGSGSNGSPVGELPSRTLFVRNINSSVEDSELRVLFEQHGDIQTLYTACKHQGFVMISYYDIRAARNAMRALQNKPLRHRKIDIHYSIPKDNPLAKDINHDTLVIFNLDSSVSNDDLRQIFGIHGEIKEINETAHKHQHKIIEFYDVRAAEAALCALNGSDIAGKKIKLEPSRPGGTRSLMLQDSLELEQDEPSLCQSFKDNSLSNFMHTVSPGVIMSSCADDESIHSSHAATSVSPFIENGFSCGSSSVPSTLHSPVGVASVCSQYGLCEPSHQAKFGKQYIPCSHPHSLPEYRDNFGNVIPYNSLSTVTEMVGNISAKITEGTDGRHICGMASNGLPVEFHGGVSGSSGNGSCSLHGHHYVWRNSNSYQHHSSSSIVWPKSPSFVNGVPPQCPPQMPGFPRVPAHMLNMVSPTHHHHVGSAPAVNPSIWDRRHAYPGESPEASAFHLGSLGTLGFPGSSPLLPQEIASHNIVSRVGGNGMDMSPITGLHSPQQMCHIFPGRNPILPMSSLFDSSSDRVRGFSHRKNEVNLSQADKKQYELDIDRILRGEDNRTTLMIKNIPNKYTSKMLLAAIDEYHRGTYDFIYLPIDFKNKCNVGYAFINMIDPRRIVPFHQTFNGKKWEKFNSEKVATLAYARIQGKAALIAHFQNSSLMNEDKRCRPILFHTDGPNAGDQEPFPMGSNIRSRLGKPRIISNEESHRQGSPSSPTNGEESSNRTDSSSSGSAKDAD